MALDDTVKRIVQGMLDSKGYPSARSLYITLRKQAVYTGSRDSFYDEFAETDLRVPKGFSKRGKVMTTGFTPRQKRQIQGMLNKGRYRTVKEIHARMKEKENYTASYSSFLAAFEEEGFKISITFGKHRKKSSQERRDEVVQIFLQYLIHTQMPRTADEGMHKALAAQYYYGHERVQRNRRSPPITLDTLERLFGRYYDAKRREEKITLQQLGQEVDIYPTVVGRVLAFVGFEPLYGKKVIHKTPMRKKEALRRATSIDMNSADIAYFVDVPEFVAKDNMSAYGRRKEGLYPVFRIQPNGKFIFYRHASQVYEAEDVGFTPEEGVQLTVLPQSAYKTLVARRAEIELIIVHALQTIYNAPEHSVPYVTKELRKKFEK